MPQTLHVERHFTGSETVKDIVIGMADGLTVPFALAAGLSGAIETTSIIVTAGLAEIAAGSIAMGLGGYMAAKSDAEHYDSERAREVVEVSEKAEIEASEVAEVFRSYGLTTEESTLIVDALRKRPQAWVDFMMRFELGLEKPNPRRALISAATIAGAYIAGLLSSVRTSFSPAPATHSQYRQSPLLLPWPLSATSRAASRARHRSVVQSRQCSLAGWRRK
jgi:vacuolar iron transporter family protein